jgi:hypothetical protein
MNLAATFIRQSSLCCTNNAETPMLLLFFKNDASFFFDDEGASFFFMRQHSAFSSLKWRHPSQLLECPTLIQRTNDDEG